MPHRTVFFISDGTGITAETFGNAILAQFEIKPRHVRLPFIDSVDKAHQAVRQINHTAEVEGKRGYLLPYHRMFAASAPELLQRYDAFYESLTLLPRILTPAERETVWAGLLAAAREVHGFIHMKRAIKAGLTQGDIVRAVAIAAVTDGFATMQFSGDNWAAWTLPDDLERAYLGAFAQVSAGLDPKLAHVTALVCHAARRHQAGMTLHLRLAFDRAGIAELRNMFEWAADKRFGGDARDYVEKFEALDLPLLVVSGSNDDLAPPSSVRRSSSSAREGAISAMRRISPTAA
jgi:alkylhydroperoxidase/carboxymuconolactone decarboxylase family protein YurZ